jgi:hypothetical protein
MLLHPDPLPMVEQAEQGRKHYYHYNIWLPLGVLRPCVTYRLLCETTKSLVHSAATYA